MSPNRAPGRRTGIRVQIPPTRLSSRNIYSRSARRLGSDELAAWNRRNGALLERYGLSISSVRVLPLELTDSVSRAEAGPLQGEHRDRLLLTAALGALAVSASGRGDLLDQPPEDRKRLKTSVKENNDRNSTAAMSEALYAMADTVPGFSARIAIGEGARKKPGERGGNPTLFAGQRFGDSSGEPKYSIAVDTVEGTGKSTLFDHSCGTLMFVAEAEMAAIPDVYFDKCQIHALGDVSVADPLERIVEATMEARGTREINFFALDRPRHPIDRMVELGASMRIDTDGDAYPVLAAGLQWGIFPDNMRALDGICGNIGGAAEMIASAAGGYYLGVRSTARFCARTIKKWEERYDFGPGEEEEIRAAGFDPGKIYSVEELVPGLDRADGVFVASAISDNWHIPGLDAAVVGSNFATVCSLFVGSAGTADIYEIEFSFHGSRDRTVEALTPIVTRTLALPLERIPAAIKEAVADTARAQRLRHEIATSYYMHLRSDPAETRMRLDLDAAGKAESAEALALLKAAVDAAPDWFA